MVWARSGDPQEGLSRIDTGSLRHDTGATGRHMLWSPTIRAALLASRANASVLEGAQAFRTQIGLCRHSNQSLFAGGNSAGKEFDEARDWAGVFGDTHRSRGTETAPSRVPGGKAAESQRLFRRRQETGIALWG
jgi:hypothetical protein